MSFDIAHTRKQFGSKGIILERSRALSKDSLVEISLEEIYLASYIPPGSRSQSSRETPLLWWKGDSLVAVRGSRGRRFRHRCFLRKRNSTLSQTLKRDSSGSLSLRDIEGFHGIFYALDVFPLIHLDAPF